MVGGVLNYPCNHYHMHIYVYMCRPKVDVRNYLGALYLIFEPVSY